MTNPYNWNGLIVTEHTISAPVDHDHPEGDRLEVFARELAEPNGQERPYLVYFQGGPGAEAPRPEGRVSGWIARALQEYRVLLLDQRGTGRSSSLVNPSSMNGPELARHLSHFRADAIVRDAEMLRSHLGVDQWSVLGQSFGGFCIMHYLSFAPHRLGEALIAGGLAPIGRHIDEVYERTYQRVLAENQKFFARFPADRQRLDAILSHLSNEDVRLPCGDRLTPRRLRQLGQMLGFSFGPDRIHYILELPSDSSALVHDVQAALPFSRNPLYAVLQEAAYADGCATRWSADRLLPPEIERDQLFTGEHVFPWMFEEYAGLYQFRDAAEILSRHEWPRLYDADVLRRNQVPVAAIIYVDDMYVDYGFSQETATAIGDAQVWITNEYDHTGMRTDGERILGRLIDMARGRA